MLLASLARAALRPAPWSDGTSSFVVLVLVAWIYEIGTITGPNFGTYFAPKNDFILEALPRAGARVSRFRF